MFNTDLVRQKTDRYILTTLSRTLWLKLSGQFSLPYQIFIKHWKCIIICSNNKVYVFNLFQLSKYEYLYDLDRDRGQHW